MTTTTGRLIYTDRAFEQDADQAMAGDIVRALIELITNADDAYGVSDGQITVDVVRQEGSPTLVAVRDVATGLSADELDSCFGVLGGVNQRFVDGVPVRGLLGRGAKDTAAFGRTVFETIKDGVYGRFELRRDSTFEKTIEPATPEHHARLEIPDGQAGLVATIHVEQPGITIPKANRLAQRLGTHVQLRRLTTGRQVVLRWSENGTRSPSQVVRWNPPAGETLVDLELDIEGYEATAHLVLSRMTNPAEGRVGSYSRQGIEVHGEKAAYDNTFFGDIELIQSFLELQFPRFNMDSGQFEFAHLQRLKGGYKRLITDTLREAQSQHLTLTQVGCATIISFLYSLAFVRKLHVIRSFSVSPDWAIRKWPGDFDLYLPLPP